LKQDFRGLKKRKRHNSNDTSQSTKNSTKPVPTSVAVKLPPKAVLIRNFFGPLRSTEMDTEITEAQNALPEQEATNSSDGFYHKPHSTTKRFKGTRAPKDTKRNPYHNIRDGGLSYLEKNTVTWMA
jgi:hypothetical protein